jgi:aminoglycoside phosphotransferase (APT) family kinase protein
VLDWEMVALGPRGLDVGWMSFLHTFFQDLAETLELPGLPGFLRIEDVAATYAGLTGTEIAHLDWFVVYAALRHGCVMARVDQRRVHFGESEPPASPDDAIMHKERLAGLIGYSPANGEGS